MTDLKYFILRRLITFLPTVVGVVALTFVIARMIPSDPARLWAGGVKAKEDVIAQLAQKYHLNEPLYVQFFYYLRDIFTGDWGVSPVTRRPVLADIASYFPATVELAVFSFVLIVVVGVPLGMVAALKRDSWVDHLVRVISIGGASLPVFWLGVLLQLAFYHSLGVLPAVGRGTPPPRVFTGMYTLDSLLCGDFAAFWDNLSHMVLPGVTLAFSSVGLIARITRGSILDTLSAEHIDFARMRGLTRWLMLKHILKNSLVPIITVLGLTFSWLLSGAIVVEAIFAWPGIGSYATSAIANVDFPAIVGVTLLMGLIYVTVNFLVDILYAIVDPRVRL